MPKYLVSLIVAVEAPQPWVAEERVAEPFELLSGYDGDRLGSPKVVHNTTLQLAPDVVELVAGTPSLVGVSLSVGGVAT